MSEINTKRISLHNLKAGMVLAKDAITQSGQLLIPSGTELTENHLFRMNLYQVLSALVIAESIDDADSSLIDVNAMDQDIQEETNGNGNQIRLNRTEGFLRFKSTINTVDLLVREQFDNILSGGPVNSDKLLAATHTLLKSVRLKSDLFAYMSHIKSDDSHTYIHSLSVSVLTNIFGRWLKFNEEDIEELTLAAMLHDVGKLKVPKELLTKSTQLTEDEFEEVREHARFGYEMLVNTDVSHKVKQAVLLHHERNDGSGYPLGLRDKEIPDFAKIIAIADVYSAMTANRSYHTKFSPFSVIQLFEQESYGYLDTRFLYIFLENIAHYYLGEKVILTDGTPGKIVFIHNQAPSRPIIQTGDRMIDLHTTPGLSIKEIL